MMRGSLKVLVLTGLLWVVIYFMAVFIDAN